MDLPVTFTDRMKELLGEDYNLFSEEYNNKPHSGIRINENKISVEEFIKIAPFEIERIPFVSNGFYINDTDEWSKHPYYFAGLYYIQEPSAMLPADILPVSKGDLVLDLCAAPGGKSTMLSTKNPSVLVSNDISFSRTIPLVKNLEIFGSGRCFVTNESPEVLSGIFGGCFDKILVDAPCSGEGMFRKDSSLIKAYENNGPEYYFELQKNILRNAVKMLKSGGKLMYSTCTFSPIEDEEVILEILKENEDLTVEKIDFREGFSSVYNKYNSPQYDAIRNCVHVFPHKLKGEGHFLCLIKKAEGQDNVIELSKPGKKGIISYQSLPEEVKSFFTLYADTDKFKNRDFLISKDGFVYILPEEYSDFFVNSIHYLRTGLVVGNINKAGKFTPHTAMALSTEFVDFVNCISFNPGSGDIIKYLKGETIIIEQIQNTIQKGFVLIKVGDFPVGFAKFDGVKLKNLYEKGWRIM